MTLVGWCPGGRTVADMLAMYPGPGAVRLFYGFRDPAPTWAGPDLGPLGLDVLPLLSFKVWDLPAMLALASAIPPGAVVGLSYHHEDEQQDGGDIPPELFVARWVELARAFEGHPKRDQIILCPIFTRYWWEKHPGDLRYWPAEVAHLLDAVGWDIYNNGATYRTPDDLLRVPREMAARTGLPYFIGELGAVRLAGDDGGVGRSAWMRAMVDAARADGALAVCWFHRLEWDLATAASAAEQQTWRDLIQEDPMPTYAQLQAEPYWGREVVTPAMDWLGDELCRRTGRPRTAFGSKGNNAHLRGAHRSQEWIKRSVYCTNRTYSVQSGLTTEQQRHIAGADFTPGEWGSDANRRLMVAQTGRLVAALKAGDLLGVREVIGTLDGRTVVGTRPDGSTFSSDSSHLDHWHLSIDRRHCNDQQLMERIVAIALDEPLEEDMPLTAEDISKVAAAAASAVHGQRIGKQTYTFGQVAERTWSYQSAFAEQKLRDEAILASIRDDADRDAILARVDQRAGELRADFEQQAQADAQRDAELAELVRAGQSGELDATEVLRRMGEVLTAGTTAPQAG